jgi:ABC-2 type transport system ATP-binding protein
VTGQDAIVTDRLVRDYTTRQGNRRALDEVSFTVPYGHVVGMLGPNGAGKTTCVRILTTLLLPTSGTARVAGADVVGNPRAVRRAVGVSFGGDSGLYTRLSGRDNLRYFGTMYGLAGTDLDQRTDRLLARVGLEERGRDRVETYSRGMRQRLHIARALLHDPRVLLLDEPSSGVDPEGARQLRTLITGLRDEGRAVLLTTHDMVEAEQLCQNVIIVNRGRVLRGATVRALRTEAARSIGHRLELEIREPVPALVLDAVPGLVRYEEAESRLLHVYTRDAATAATFLMEKLGDDVLSLHVNTPSLEDAYLATVQSS